MDINNFELLDFQKNAVTKTVEAIMQKAPGDQLSLYNGFYLQFLS